MPQPQRETWKESEGELFRLLVQNVKDYAIFVVDPQGRVQSWNPGAERLLGYRDDEIIGQSTDIFFTPEDIASGVPEREMQASLQEGGGNDDRWHVRKDGSRFWSGGMMTPLWDNNRKLRGFAKIMRDRTEWKRAEQARHGSEARQAAILETALDGIISIDHNGRVTEFNPAAEKLFGYTKADVQGRDIGERIVPPRLREAHQRGMAHYLSTGDGPVLGQRLEMPALRADGTEIIVELAITRVPTDGPPLFTAYLRDISEKTRAERYRSARLAVAQVLAQTANISEAATGLLRAICENLGWDVGFFWMLSPSADALYCLESWHTPGVTTTKFEAASRQRSFRRGEGLPGHVWSTGKATWLLDVLKSTNFPRAASAAEEGLHSAFACPVVVGDRTLGVIEFFSQLIQEPAPDLLETMATVTGLVGQFVERKASEEALRESEARFRGLMEQAPFSIQVFAPDGRTVRVNRAWEKLWGVTLDQIAGYNVLEDQQLEVKGILPLIRQAFAGEPVHIPAIEYDPNETIADITRHHDSRRWTSGIAYPLKDTSGRVREVILVHEDITARKRAEESLRESEEKLRLMADTIPQLAWMARPDGHIFWYNRRWYEYTGTTPQQMEGWGWQSVHDPHALPKVLERWKGSIDSGKPFDMVFPLKGADGQFRPFLTRVNPLRDEAARILYWFGTNTDISDIKRMEEALRDADRRKDEFLATLAHELRNPLAPIRNSLQILKMARVDAVMAQQTREMMERQVNHLVRLVDDLLDVSRVMRGKIELRKEPVELATIVARAVETAKPLIEVQGHQLEISLPPDSLLLDADPVRLAQVVGNLLTNSAKYTEANGHIQLSAEREADQAVLRVRDDGIGIASDMLPNIFELFVQVDHASTKAQGGLGIGLTLVKNLVEMHGGSVEAKSAGLGEGCEFVVRLPLVARRTQQPNDEASAEHNHATSSYGHRLLVVDDNHDAALSLSMLLRLQGHEVRVAHDGSSALEIAVAFRPDLIFLDIGMPGMDGYEVARRVRQTSGLEKTVLAALTGWGQQEDRRRTSEAGFNHHLVKPPEPKAVDGVLAELKRPKRSTDC